MSASSKTSYYDLPIYQADDPTSWLTDFNGAMEKIDAALHAIAQGGGGGGETINVVQTTGQSTTDVMSQKAVSDQLATINTEISGAESSLANINTGNGVTL